MVFLFSWRKICQDAGRSSNTVIRILDMLAYNKIPRNRWDPIYPFYGKDYSGKSFLLNLHGLLGHKSHYKPRDIANYVALASLRNYANYATSNDRSLDILHSPVSIEIIKANKLLTIRDNKILFKYEENK